MTSIPKVLIIGTGALGLVAAYTLEYNKTAEVTIVVRSGYEKAVAEGYTINSVQFGQGIMNWRPSHIAKDVYAATADNQSYDYIFVSLKNLPDSPKTCEEIIEPAVLKNPNSSIILCQNGIDIEKPMIENFPGHIILSAVSLIGCTNVDCVVSQLTPDNVQVGLFENPTIKDKEVGLAKVSQWIDMYHIEGKNICKMDNDVRLTRWQKIVYNSAINTTTALVDLDFTRCAMTGFKETVCRPIMKEIYQIAKSDGYIIPAHLEQVMLDISDGLFYTPSMLVDIRLGRMIELEIILGNPLRIAQKNGIEVPNISMMYNLLKMVQFRTMEKLGYVTVDEEYEKSAGGRTYKEYGKGF
ncbi:hypothetical protein CANARDRAFT_21821 [[Candida] arabinofermentans NRRL YB-2248]|uniref:2-dehydropantoate 2-reductase n=1 Tax=[Candida] arabinofermentans NRRL YB-2248 TaxID=983967 RepID=A0A1E4T507_9ASCO|nr:hypothetical protein CANARDRAFT_21821 [[Candida] arabinofermentans NRRL YB-2248]